MEPVAVLVGAALGRVAVEACRNERRSLAPQRVLLGALAAGSLALVGDGTGHVWLDLVERALLLLGVALLFRRPSGRRRWAPVVCALVAALFAANPVAGAIGGAGAVLGLLVASPTGGVALGLGLATVGTSPHGFIDRPTWWVGPVALLVGCASVLPRPRSRRAILGAATGAAVAVGLALLVAAPIRAAARHGRQAEAQVRAARSALAAGRIDDAAADLRAARASVRRVRADTRGVRSAPMRLTPVLGQQARFLDRALPVALGALDAGDRTLVAASPARLQRGPGQFDLAAIGALDAPLADLDAHLAQVRTLLAERPATRAGRVEERLDGVDDELGNAAIILGNVRSATTLVPSMLGAHETRHVLVAVLASSEVRGSSGILGSFADLDVRDGRLALVRTGRSEDINPPEGTDLATVAGRLDGTDPSWRAAWATDRPDVAIQNVTSSPDFRDVGLATAKIVGAATGRTPDLVIGVDPTAIAALLRITGPIEVAGWPEGISSANAVQILGLDSYVRYPSNTERVPFLLASTEALATRLTSARAADAASGTACLAETARARHLFLWSSRLDEAALLRSAGLDGAVPAPTSAREVAGIVLNNAGGNKLDWFLDRQDRVRREDGRTIVSTTLRNGAPASGLPTYVAGNNRSTPQPLGTSTLLVSGYAGGPGAIVTVDGKVVAPLRRAVDQGSTITSVLVEMAPGSTHEVSFTSPSPGGTTLLELPDAGGARDQPCPTEER